MPSAPRQLRPRLPLSALWLVGAIAVLGAPVLFSGESHYLRDFLTNYVPARALLRAAVAAGEPWLWNPFLGGGLPTLPDACNSLLYFPAWPTLLFADQAWALSLTVWGHLVLAALGAQALARRVMEPAGATATAVVFALGGLMVSNQLNAHFEFAYAWAPLWLHLALGGLEGARGLRPWLAAGAVLGLQLLAPEPQVVAEELFLSLGLVASAGRGRWGRAALGAAAMAALAAVLAAPQLAAFAEALGQTQRGAMTPAEVMSWSLPPTRAWELLLPLPFGELTPVPTFWATHLVGGSSSNFYFASLYAGALAVPLAALGFTRVRGRGWWLLAMGAALALLALGSATPLYRWAVEHLPLWRAFRYPERLWLWPSLGLAALVGLGVEVVAQRPRATALLALPALVGAAVLRWPTLVDAAAGRTEVAALVQESALRALQLSLVALLVALLLLRRGPGLRGAALLGLLTVDLLAAGLRTQATWAMPPLSEPPWPATHRALVQVPAVSQASRQAGDAIAARRAFEVRVGRPNLSALSGRRTVNAVTSLDLHRVALLRRALGVEGAALAYDGRWLVAAATLAPQGFTPVRPLEGGLALFEASGARGEVSCAAGFTVAAEAEEAARAVAAGEAVVEGAIAPPAEPPRAVPCRLTRGPGARLAVEVGAHPAPVLVTVRDSWYPGWRARAGAGRWEEARPSDVAFLGAVLAPGQTTVEFEYAPRWLWPTAVLALGGWLAAAVGWLRSRRS